MSRAVVPAVTLPPLLQAVLLWRNPIGQLSRWSRRHGDLFTCVFPPPGRWSWWVIRPQHTRS